MAVGRPAPSGSGARIQAPERRAPGPPCRSRWSPARRRWARPSLPLLSAAGSAPRRLPRAAARFELGVGPESRAARGAAAPRAAVVSAGRGPLPRASGGRGRPGTLLPWKEGGRGRGCPAACFPKGFLFRSLRRLGERVREDGSRGWLSGQPARRGAGGALRSAGLPTPWALAFC